MPLMLYAFRYKSPVTGKWVKARYVAELHEIRERHGDEFELAGEPEVREVRDAWRASIRTASRASNSGGVSPTTPIGGDDLPLV